jgi:ribose transport system permease protein
MVSVGLVVVLALVFYFITDGFFSGRNITVLLRDSAFLGILACGMSIAMIAGGIDLSVGGIACVVGILCTHLSVDLGLNGYIVLLCGIIIGGVCGVINGFIVAKIGLAEFVTTLASGFAFTGLGLIFAYRNASGILQPMRLRSATYLSLGHQAWEGGLFWISIAWIVVTVVVFIIMKKTKFGLYTYAIGSNRRAAEMSGVNYVKTKWIGFVISGGLAGMASVFYTANVQSSSASLGTMQEFLAIAACVVGGVVLGGGKGDTINAFLGALFMIMILNGLAKFNINSAWQYVFQGGIIIVATAFDAQFAKIAHARRVKEQRLSAVQ